MSEEGDKPLSDMAVEDVSVWLQERGHSEGIIEAFRGKWQGGTSAFSRLGSVGICQGVYKLSAGSRHFGLNQGSQVHYLEIFSLVCTV